MSYTDVPGAKLYHEIVGQGPLLICISGGDGSCEIWRFFAQCLKEHFTVLLWDRRGFSRSYLTGSQDYEHRLETDVDDAAHLVQQYSPNEPATVIGNSSGAIVALHFLLKHPNLIQSLISYEPPLASILPELNAIQTAHEDIYDAWRRHGPAPAFAKFAELIRSDPSVLTKMMMSFEMNPYRFSNIQYWFEREFMHYPFAPLDVEHDLAPLKHKLMLVNGELSSHEPYQYKGNEVIGEVLGLRLLHFPGEHVGHATHAKEFATSLLEALKEKEKFRTDSKLRCSTIAVSDIPQKYKA